MTSQHTAPPEGGGPAKASPLGSSNEKNDYGATTAVTKIDKEEKQQQATTGMTSDRLDELLASSEPSMPQQHRRTQSHTTALLGHRPSYYRRRIKLHQQQQYNQQQRRRHHHRRHTSLSEFLLDVGDDAADEFRAVGASLMEELHDYDSGRSPYLMDMSLVRSLSVLPEDLTEFVNETVFLQDVGEEEEEEVGPLIEITAGAPEAEAETPTKIPVSAYILLLVAVLAVSSNGTALHLLYGVPAPLKLYWRLTATASILFFFAVKSVFWNKMTSTNDLASLCWSHWGTLAAAAVFFCAHTLLLYTALEFTTIGNAIIYANSQALLLIVGKACVGEPVTALEYAGVATAFAGALLCSRDSEGSGAEELGHTKALARWGDGLALLSAVAGVAYLTLAKAVRPYMSVTLFMFLVTLGGSWMVLLYLLATGVPVTMDRDPVTGLWGWMTVEGNHVWILLHIAVVCNVLGTMGFVRAMQYFDTVLIAVATLMEPMIASVIAHIFRVGLLPGPLGYLGNALVTLGTIAVVASSAGKGDGGAGH